MQIETTIHVWREGGHYIAHAMPIDVASSGETADKARAALNEALKLFIDTARDAGALDDVLEECGYHRANGIWVAPEMIDQHQAMVAG